MAELRVLNQSKQASGKRASTGKSRASIAIHLAAGLEKIGLAMKSRTWRREGRAGLGPLQRQVLTLLRTNPAKSAQVSAIANELVIRLPTASEAVATLERKKLVKRRRSMRDGRIVTVELTARGERACDPSMGMPSHLISATGALTSAEQVALLKSLMKVIRTLQERGEISVARMCVSCRYFRPNQYNDSVQPHHCDFLNAPFGEHALRLECAEYEPATPAQARDSWSRFTGGRQAVG
ncbi:MAG TPA: MarR family winged helix-turn-helix transcriptional regulator [Nitrospira sp.]